MLVDAIVDRDNQIDSHSSINMQPSREHTEFNLAILNVSFIIRISFLTSNISIAQSWVVYALPWDELGEGRGESAWNLL